MKRAGILLLVLLFAAVFAGSAQAVQPAKVKEVLKSGAAVKDYWTAERIAQTHSTLRLQDSQLLTPEIVLDVLRDIAHTTDITG